MSNQAAIEPILTQVNEALGHIIIHGEQRGNFAVSQQLADQALELPVRSFFLAFSQLAKRCM